LKRNGPRPSAWRVILDAAHRDRTSIWEVLRAIRRQKGFPLGMLLGMQLGKHRTLIEPDVLKQLTRIQPIWLHPLLGNHKDADPAKLLHAEQVLPADDYFDTFCGPNYPDRVSPILSQPVVELCLRIPRHLLISGGWNRAVARRAFQSLLPCEIVTRTEKGGVRELFRGVLRSNMEFVRETLLDGELVKRHIISIQNMTAALSGDPTRSKASAEELMVYMCVEGWLHQFQS